MERFARYLIGVCVWLALVWIGAKPIFVALHGKVEQTTRESLMWVICIAVFVICMVASQIGVRKQVPTLRRKPITVIDPAKWSLDPDTGEHHRRIYNGREGGLVNAKTYEEISLRRIQLERSGGTARTGVILCSIAVAFLLFICVAEWDNQFISLMAGLGLIVAVTIDLICLLVWSVAAIDIRRPRNELPPPPIPRPGREQVEQQKVHGAGGFATPSEIDAAGRGSVGGPGPQGEPDLDQYRFGG